MKQLILTSIIFSCLYCNTLFSATNPIPVLNHNFEADLLDLTTKQSATLSGWLADGQGTFGVASPTNSSEYSNHGDRGQSAFLTGGARLSQSLPITLRNKEAFTLTFDVGHPANSSASSVVARLTSQGLILGQQQVDIQSIPEGTWQTKTVKLTITENMPLGKPLAIEFYNLSKAEGDIAHIDNIALDVSGLGAPLRLEKTGSGIITNDVTLRVPEDYTTIQEALDFLKPHFIQANKQVTIKVSSCVAQTQPLVLDHPQGGNIQLIGNIGNPGHCVLKLAGNPAIYISNGNEFGLIDGFTLQHATSTTPKDYGVRAYYNGTVTLGENMVISGFSRAIHALDFGVVIADGVSFINNTIDIESARSSVVTARNSNSVQNHLYNFYALQAGRIFAEGAHTANINTNTTQAAYFSRGQSYINVDNATSIANGYHLAARGGSAISAQNMETPLSNASYVESVQELSFIDRTDSDTSHIKPYQATSSTVKQ